MNGGKSIKIFKHINIYDIEVVGMRITTQVLVLIRHLYMPKRNLTKIHGGGIINTKCIVISKIQGAQIGWNHRTVYALPSESAEFVSGKSKRRL